MKTNQVNSTQENILSQEDKELIIKALKSGEVGKEKLERAKKLFQQSITTEKVNIA